MRYIKIHVGYLTFNMKNFIDGIIVVEGTCDTAYLSSFIDALFIETNGNELPSDEINFLKHSGKKVIVLTDSDAAGAAIRERINKEMPNAINVVVDLAKCNKKNKHGIAECEKSEIINVLMEHFTNKENKSLISNFDLIDFGVNGKMTRKYLCEKLNLGRCNQKELLKRINFLGILANQIQEVMRDYGNK